MVNTTKFFLATVGNSYIYIL